MAYTIEWVNFKIVDKKNLKRTVVQDKLLEPIRMYFPTMKASDHSNILGIYLLDQFTLLKDRILEIEILEKNGGRYQKVRLKNKDLIHARLITD